MGGTSWATEKSFTTLSLADFLSAQIQGDADVAISRRRRRLRIVVDDVGFVFLHEIQKWPLAGVFTSCFFTFEMATNGVDGLPESVFSHRPLHVLELNRRRILHFRCDCGFGFFQNRIG